MKKKSKIKTKTKNPNSRFGLMLVIAIAFSITLLAVPLVVNYLQYQRNVNSGMFNAIVDAVPPTVVATVGNENDEQTGKEVSFQINDNAGGSALYGFCLSEDATADAAISNDAECFDTFLLESNISYNLVLEIPYDSVPVTYYAYAKDNFGNISLPVQFIVEK